MKNGSLKFFRKFYQIPKKQKLCWCLLLEVHNDSYINFTRLGILFIGTDKAIDVASRRIIQLNGHGAISYNAYPAKRHSKGEMYEYVHDNNLKLLRPKHYVQDIYFACVYSKELMDAQLS